jgi:DNA invertase Pin-like site-specific DNA recombinase
VSKKRAKAYSYLRVSGKGQVKGDGFPRQRKTIQTYALKNGFEIEDEYRDEGVSGTNELADRAGLAVLLDRIESNGIRTVIVEKADRLARDLMIGEVILSQFRDVDVTVLDCSGNDLTEDEDPTRTLIRQVLGAVSQFDKSVIVLKLKAARDRKSRLQGNRVEGKKPFGHFEDEEETLREIIRLRRKPRNGRQRRLSYDKIAESLNSHGYATRTGRPWIGATVRKIVLREKK